jgi:hypothetical protein
VHLFNNASENATSTPSTSFTKDMLMRCDMIYGKSVDGGRRLDRSTIGSAWAE